MSTEWISLLVMDGFYSSLITYREDNEQHDSDNQHITERAAANH